jgi:glutathione S-transferase
MPLPVLYSNDTCPYAFRARCVLQYAGIEVEHREITFDNKPPGMLRASPKGTVPTLVLDDGTVIDESWDVMRWAISINDPDNWAGDNRQSLKLADSLVEENDGDFSNYVYYYKYASDYPQRSATEDRDRTMAFANRLEGRLVEAGFLDGNSPGIGDMAVFPFVRSLYQADPDWFSRHYKQLQRWLGDIEALALVKSVSATHQLWEF